MAPVIRSAVTTALALLTALQPGSVGAGPIGARSNYAVKDFHPAPRAWSNVAPAPAEHVVHLSIGLSQGRFNELERHLYEVSDPSHSRYGQHLSAAEVHELVKPADEALDAVHEWLQWHGIQKSELTYSPAQDWIKVTLPVSAIETLLDTKYSVYEHDDGSVLVRTERWSLPLHLHEHITTIQPTNSWARLDARSRRKELKKRTTQYIELDGDYSTAASSRQPVPDNASIQEVCNFTAVTPRCLRTLYGTLLYEPRAPGWNQMALTDYLGEMNNRSDISTFLGLYRPEAQAAAYEFRYVSIADGPVDNGTNVAEAGVDLEGNLDAEYMLGIAWPTPLTAFTTGGLNPTFVPDLETPTDSDEPYLTWVNYVLEQEFIPQTISTSYGDDEQTVSKAYAEAVCNQFAQLGARGVTLLFASGDFGVGADGTCISNLDNTTYMFLPGFPSGCPYVTNVGATKDYPEVAALDELRSGNNFTSGAGFSNYFDRPAYQAEVVDAYVASLNGEYDGFYNKSGRAYPDIACIGQRFPTIWNGTTVGLDGTSGSSPICASVITLVNDALIAAGRPPLGFLNPWLYGTGHKGFTDVTSGSSAGCGTNGFPAAVGWDAVTGFGSPYLPSILKELGL